MKRTLLCVLLALSMLLTTGCGNGAVSSPAASGGSSAGTSAGSSSGASSSAVSSGTTEETIPEFQPLNYSIGLLDNGFFEGITAQDHVTLPKLEGIVIPKDVQTVTDEALQEAIDEILAQYAGDGRIYDRAVEKGDQVNIDYIGMVGGVAFNGGNTNGAGTMVTAGGTEYIDDFLDQIIGCMPGETINVEVTFPESYPSNPNLAGQDAVFQTKINYIQGEIVNPELTDELVTEKIQGDYGYTSVEDMKQSLTKTLREDQMRVHVLDWLIDNTTFGEVPAKIIEDQREFLRGELNNNANYYQMPLSEMLSYYGLGTLDSLYEAYQDSFVEYGQQYLMCQAAAEKLGIVIGEKERDDYFFDVLGLDSYDSAAKYYGLGYISQEVMVNQVAEYLLENAIVE